MPVSTYAPSRYRRVGVVAPAFGKANRTLDELNQKRGSKDDNDSTDEFHSRVALFRRPTLIDFVC